MILTELEKKCLFKKAGFINSLLDELPYPIEFRVDMFNPLKAEANSFDHRSWCGGHNSGGNVGWVGSYEVTYVKFSGRQFVILQVNRQHMNGSSYQVDEDDDDPFDGTYVFSSDGVEEDMKRVKFEALKYLGVSDGGTHLPEALEMLREEYAGVQRVGELLFRKFSL